ncbi:1-acylglycerol-3-phosphate O-acyltransferase [Psittacicella hinzii]|nr:1-acylglycerol-3-phosphate O-acyltransferase [Psittacicella hinzii]
MNMYRIAYFVRPLLRPVYGLNTKVEQEMDSLPKTAVYISNHQNTLDIVTLAKMIQPNTVTVGKRQLSWIPIFGWMYWASGNILIEKTSASKSYKTVQQVVEKITKHKYCVWLFPEGTRSYGRWEIAPFKSGAFLTAIEAGVPIVPIVVSNLNEYKLGKLDNGTVIMKYLKPINTKGMSKSQAKQLAKELEKVFLDEYRKLNQKVKDKDFTDCKDMAKFNYIETQEWLDNNPEYQFSTIEK